MKQFQLKAQKPKCRISWNPSLTSHNETQNRSEIVGEVQSNFNQWDSNWQKWMGFYQNKPYCTRTIYIPYVSLYTETQRTDRIHQSGNIEKTKPQVIVRGISNSMSVDVLHWKEMWIILIAIIYKRVLGSDIHFKAVPALSHFLTGSHTRPVSSPEDIWCLMHRAEGVIM